MKTVFLFLALMVISPAAFSQTPTPTPASEIGNNPAPSVGADVPTAPGDLYVRPDAKTRRKRFINSTVGPIALGRNVATAGIGTWRNSPEEWGTKWEGFGRRVASNLGKNAIKQTTKFSIDEALKIDSHFYRSKSTSTGARIRNALISPVTARDKNGKRVIGISNLVGTYGSNIIAYEAWYPDRYNWKHGVRSGTISLGFNAAFNLFKEFVWKK